MARSAQLLLGSALALLASSAMASAGCGLDAVGSLVVSDAAPPPPGSLPDGAPPSTDAASSSDADEDANANVGVDAGPGPCADPAIVLCVGFDGTLTDDAHAQPIVASGNITFVPGVVGQAVHLDATSVLTLADNPAWTYTSMTVETWVWLDALPVGAARSGLLDKDSSFGVFVYADGTVNCIMNQTAGAKVLTKTAQWVHIACVNDGSSTKLYADGVVQASVPAGNVAQTVNLVAIGNNSPNLGSPLLGALDLLRVYARAKSAAEVAADAKR
jgi:hypothetical protein